MIHILLVEDEEKIAESVAFNLRNVGYDVTIARTRPRAEEEIESREPGAFDLLILDRMLPGGEGLEIARLMRRRGDFSPILVLTARDVTGEVVQALDAGADDYLTKPFDLDELLARIRVLLRRQAWVRASGADREPGSRIFSFGKCWVDFQTFEAQGVDGRKVQLGRKEALLLHLLVEEEGRPVSRGRLLEEVWGAPADLTTRTVDNFVLRLRRLFEEIPSQPRHIQTVRGVGYRFVR